jgi:hypothetical protein
MSVYVVGVIKLQSSQSQPVNTMPNSWLVLELGDQSVCIWQLQTTVASAMVSVAEHEQRNNFYG